MSGVTDAEIAEKIARIAAAFRLAAVKAARKQGRMPEGLTLSERLLLEKLREAGRMTMSEFAAAVESPTSVVSRQIDSLARRGLVSRRRSTQDRRVVHVCLTPKGRQLLNDLEEQEKERFRYMAGLFNLEQTKHLRKALSEILDVILEGLSRA